MNHVRSAIESTSRSVSTFALCILFFGLANPVRAADGPAWLRDLDQAKQVASKEVKDLLIVFTGHGWCQPCELMDRGLFRKSSFVNAADKTYVFVELDFNFEDSPEGKRRETDFNALKTAYLVHAFPTVVLADASGNVYAIFTGYDTDSDVDAYLKVLDSARRAKAKRDELLMAAARKSGDPRAVLLDEAITSIEPMLGSLDDRGDDPVLHFYGPVVEEILALLALTDTNKVVSDKYLSRRRSRDERASKEALFAKIDEYLSNDDYVGATGFIERSLEATEDARTRWELEYKRQVYLEWSDRNEEALANCRRLLAINSLANADRESLLDREAHNLSRLGRIDECIENYDKRLAAADLTPAKKAKILWEKAHCLFGGDRLADSISAWRAYRETTEHGTDNWRDATALLARELRRDRRYDEALNLFKEFLQEDRHTWVLLDAAETCVALSDRETALSFIEESRTLNGKLANSERKGERDDYERVEVRIKKVMEMATAIQSKPSGEGADRTMR
jgi:thioredoxin-related protein